jgi:hypothetical protein
VRLRFDLIENLLIQFDNLVRFFYILEQQYQNDSNEVLTEARENLLKYIDQFRQSDDVVEEVDDDQQSEQSDEPQQPEPIVFHNPVRIFLFIFEGN